MRDSYKLETHTQNLIMFFHGSSGYANALNAAFIRTLPVLY